MSFYLPEGAVLVILLYEVRGVNIFGIFPCVVTFGVPFPLDEVLKAF